ncbi:MAG: hypothetical protein HYV19_03385 [Gemmatimonadetes bacterium]|nr:hypothetical protein [Gemmatimonadota bacterium]
MSDEGTRTQLPFAGAAAEILTPGVALVAACLEGMFVTFVWDFNRDLRLVLRCDAAAEGEDMRHRGMADCLFEFVFDSPQEDGSMWHVAYNDGYVQHWSADWTLVGTSRWGLGDELPSEAREAQLGRVGKSARVGSDVAFELRMANGQIVTVKTDGVIERRLPGAPNSDPIDVDRIEQPAGVQWARAVWNQGSEEAEWFTCGEMPWPRLGVALLNPPPAWVTSAHAESLADELCQRKIYPAIGTAAVYVRPVDPASSATVSGLGVEPASWLLPALVVWHELGAAEQNEDGDERTPVEGFATQAAVVQNVLFIAGVESAFPLDSVEISDAVYTSPEGFSGITLAPLGSSNREGNRVHIWVADRHGGAAVLEMISMLQALARDGVESTTWFRDWQELWRAATAPVE